MKSPLVRSLALLASLSLPGLAYAGDQPAAGATPSKDAPAKSTDTKPADQPKATTKKKHKGKKKATDKATDKPADGAGATK